MRSIYLIFASQDYERANHKSLWKRMAEQTNSDVVVIDVPADYLICMLRGKKERLNEAKEGFRQIENNLYVVRPKLIARPDYSPPIFYKSIAHQIWSCLEKKYPDIKRMRINALIYNAYWAQVLYGSHPDIHLAYYLFDEVRYEASTNQINKKRFRQDEFACQKSDTVFTMTQVLKDSRAKYNARILVLGNGADYSSHAEAGLKYPNSVGFIGNFRNWVDQPLLEALIRQRPDVIFGFIGPVESDMKPFLDKLLNNYMNTFYGGCVSKENVKRAYGMFDCIIIPYLQNDFIKATRPIKIVESVMAGTPVVTIPVDGYQELPFIRFARTANEFSDAIDRLISEPIDRETELYKKFIAENTWETKAEFIINEFERGMK